MFKYILPIILVATTIISYVSLDYLTNKKDNNNSSKGNSYDDNYNNQLTDETSINEIIDDNHSHFNDSPEEKTNAQEYDNEIIDVDEQSTNEIILTSTPLDVQASIKQEVKEQFIILKCEDVCGGPFANLEIADTIKDEQCVKSSIKEQKVNVALDQCDSASVEEEEADEYKSNKDHFGTVPLYYEAPAEEERIQLKLIQIVEEHKQIEETISEEKEDNIVKEEQLNIKYVEEEQIIKPTTKEEELDIVEILKKAYEKRKKQIETSKEDGNEINGTVVNESIVSPVININASTTISTATNSSAPLTNYSTTSSTKISQTGKKVHHKCNVPFETKNLIKYFFMVQNGGKQQQQQLSYQRFYSKYHSKDEKRNELLITGYSYGVNDIQLLNFFRGCNYEEFIYGSEVTYFRLSSCADFERAISLHGSEISMGNQLYIINYNGGLKIPKSSIVCHRFENNTCNGYNCKYLHGEPLRTTDSVSPQIYQKCFNPNHMKWCKTMPLLKLNQFNGREYDECINCFEFELQQQYQE